MATGWVVLITVLCTLLVIAAAGYAVFHHFYGMMNTTSSPKATAAPTQAVSTPDPNMTPTPEPTATPEPTPAPLTEEELAKLEEQHLIQELQESAEELITSDDVYNILLLGADGRTETLERSDAMILLSVNHRTKTIWLTSLMRDTQVYWPGGGQGHLNWATSMGGVDMLIDTIEYGQNFSVDVNNWALVDFLDFAEVANLLGPVTVTVTPDEAKDINGRIREACQIYDRAHGLPEDHGIPRYYFPEEGGTFTISDGFQILGYCRERYFGGDTGRSAKQREVLMQMWNNVKKMSLREMYELANTVFGIVNTDMTEGQCASLLLQAPAMLNYDIKAQQCPTPGAFWKGRDDYNLSIYNADFRVNRNFLRATIYGEEMPQSELVSYWTGNAILVYDPETGYYYGQ
ncbi:MAG: LCP family protein [Oscillospiraceae bacterium]|nr:LCP family protein [Oscillospiraceae bacterium]